jgi:hypothetical protein
MSELDIVLPCVLKPTHPGQASSTVTRWISGLAWDLLRHQISILTRPRSHACTRHLTCWPWLRPFQCHIWTGSTASTIASACRGWWCVQQMHLPFGGWIGEVRSDHIKYDIRDDALQLNLTTFPLGWGCEASSREREPTQVVLDHHRTKQDYADALRIQ